MVLPVLFLARGRHYFQDALTMYFMGKSDWPADFLVVFRAIGHEQTRGIEYGLTHNGYMESGKSAGQSQSDFPIKYVSYDL